MARTARIFVIVAFAALTVTACGSADPTNEGLNAGTDLAAPPATSAVTVAPAATQDPNIAQTPASIQTQAPENAAAEPASAVVAPAPNRDDVNVDARDFEQGGQYFFKSPSGNVYCAFHSFNAPGTDVGCQVRYSVPGNTGRVCGNVANNTYGVQIREGGPVEQICTNQGIFVANDMRVLEYGQTIGVQGDICRSTEAGITCYSGSGSGFMISRDVNVAF